MSSDSGAEFDGGGGEQRGGFFFFFGSRRQFVCVTCVLFASRIVTFDSVQRVVNVLKRFIRASSLKVCLVLWLFAAAAARRQK